MDTYEFERVKKKEEERSARESWNEIWAVENKLFGPLEHLTMENKKSIAESTIWFFHM